MVVLGMVFAACQPQTVEVEVVKTVIVTEEVIVEGETVIKEVVVTATPAPVEPTKDPNAPKEGGKGDVYRAAVLEDLTTLNYWSAYGPINSSMWNYVVEGTYHPFAYGLGSHRWDYAPALAEGMPTELEQEGDF
ncbi:MAG TPA: hypothetical protein VLM78_09600, partial [Anaerolineales bacterium]|nr:hypothetical protein [Anaerolineales bacterium]